MIKKLVFISFLTLPFLLSGQEKSLNLLLADTCMKHSSVSLCILNAASGETVYDYDSEKSLMPASIQKIFSSATALELLGPDYSFKTILGYTGSLNNLTGQLTGNIIIKGGGDPALGSRYFKEYYGDFISKWITEIRKLGIKKISGKIIADDSYYDYQPVPGKWLWEDTGNYYGAGAFGLSVFDNIYEIHFKTTSGTPVITEITPEQKGSDISNFLRAAGNTDKGYVYAAPYSLNSWVSGTIPAGKEDFVLKAAVTDPPLLLAQTIDSRLRSENIIITGIPSTARLEKQGAINRFVPITETVSPPLKEIVNVQNHESVNLFAEHLTKELGKVIKSEGSTSAGIEVIDQFLKESEVPSDGIFLEDGCGMSPLNAINARGMSIFLLNMKTRGRYFREFYASLPEAGENGTLKNHFIDHIFYSNLKAKSGSMTRVKSYAGYFKTIAGHDLVFCIIINNYTGPSQRIVNGIEDILKETILHK